MKSGYLSLALVSGLLAFTVSARDFSTTKSCTPPPSGPSFPCDDAQFLQDQQAFENGQITADRPENVCGIVTAVLPAKKTRSGNHGYFYVQVATGSVIEIVNNLDEMSAPKWPWVSVGDSVTVRGRYYYDNDASQGIDWTHHGTSSSWPQAGYVVVNGKEYQ